MLLIISNTAFSQANHVREENQNVVGLFFGATSVDDRTFMLTGLEYHRILSWPFGVSFFYEKALKSELMHDSDLYATATFNVFEKFVIGVGPGLRHEHRGQDRLLARASGVYIFHLKPDIEIAPQLSFDLVEGRPGELIAGVTLGKQF
tara:strand:- start:698 stop:1141 length:444 start_codon:yes stop_codon:yes gene_type:complete